MDNSATTKVCDAAVEAMVEIMTKNFGNPSSLHRKGIKAEKKMEESRKAIADTLQVKPGEIYFTSGGTESNNLAIKGAAYSMCRMGNHIITTAVEHPSVLECFKELKKEGFEVTYLQVDKEGKIDIEELKEKLTSSTILVSIMYVNSEVGSIMPIEEAGDLIKAKSNAIFHVDAVQAVGKIPTVKNLNNIDLLSVSSHKIHGPKGVGALFVRDKVRINPLFKGGGQEKDLRSGTENMPGIVGFGEAVKTMRENFCLWKNKMYKLKQRLQQGILEEVSDVVINGPMKGAPHILNMSFLGTRGEVLLHALESKGIYVSTGSACSSNRKGKSHVLMAMGKSDDEVDSAVRFSLSPFLSFDDIDYTIDILKKSVKEIRKFVWR